MLRELLRKGQGREQVVENTGFQRTTAMYPMLEGKEHGFLCIYRLEFESWSYHFLVVILGVIYFLSLSFLICKMGIIILTL